MKDCKTCANYTDFNEVDNGCYMCCKGLGNNYQPKQTNAGRIRSMTDEELARDLIPLIMEVCEDGVPCEELFLDWLQSEAE